MRTFAEIANDGMLEELQEVLDQCRHCRCHATVKQFARVRELNSNGQYEENINFTRLQETVFNVTSLILIDNGFYNITLKTADVSEFSKIEAFRKTVMERNHERFMSKQEEDYLLTIDLVKENQKENLMFEISFMNPMFMTIEDGDLLIACSLENGRFGKHTVDFVQALEEAEYEEEQERMEEELEERRAMQREENRAILNNNDVLNVVSDEDDEDYEYDEDDEDDEEI